MQDIDTIEHYLSEHIPITKALAIKIDMISNNEVIVSAPLENNINHKKTVFGGSLHAVATLACWSFLYQQFIEQLSQIEIVIFSSEVDYLLPVTSDFKAVCGKPDNKAWAQFIKVLNKKGKARLSLNAKIFQAEQLAVDYRGTFVVLANHSVSSKLF